MINFDDYLNENKTKHNQNWSYGPDHPYKILVIGGSGSGKTNVLLNLIDNQPGIDKIFLYAKHLYEAEYQYLINKRESVGLIILMILNLLMSIQMKFKIIIKILTNTMPIKNVKY